MKKVLLDENLPHQLRHHLKPNDAYTTAAMGWSGLKNGALLKVAEDVGFEVFVTGDLSIEYQQNLAARNIAIVSMSTTNWRIAKGNVAEIAAAVSAARPGQLIRVYCGVFRRRRPRFHQNISIPRLSRRIWALVGRPLVFVDRTYLTHSDRTSLTVGGQDALAGNKCDRTTFETGSVSEPREKQPRRAVP